MTTLAEVSWLTYFVVACKIGTAWGLVQFVAAIYREVGTDLAKAYVRDRRVRRYAKVWGVNRQSAARTIAREELTGK